MRTATALVAALSLLQASGLVAADAAPIDESSGSIARLIKRVHNISHFGRDPIPVAPLQEKPLVVKRASGRTELDNKLIELEKREASKRMVKISKKLLERNPLPMSVPHSHQRPRDHGRKVLKRAVDEVSYTTTTASPEAPTTSSATSTTLASSPASESDSSSVSIPPWGLTPSDPDKSRTYILVPFGESSSLWRELFTTIAPSIPNMYTTPSAYVPLTTIATSTTIATPTTIATTTRTATSSSSSSSALSIPLWGLHPSDPDHSYTLLPFGASSSIWVELYPPASDSLPPPRRSTPYDYPDSVPTTTASSQSAPTSAPTDSSPQSVTRDARSSERAARRKQHKHNVAVSMKSASALQAAAWKAAEALEALASAL